MVHENLTTLALPPDASGNPASESQASQLGAPGGGTAGVMANYPFNDLGTESFLQSNQPYFYHLDVNT